MLAHRLEKTCDVNSVQNLFTLRYSRELPKAMRKPWASSCVNFLFTIGYYNNNNA